MSDKKRSKWKIVLISVISVILVLSAAAAGTYQFYIKPKYADKLIETADKVLQSEEVKSLLESEEVQKILEDEGTKQLLDNMDNLAENDELNNFINSQGNSENTNVSAENPSAGNNEQNKNDENNKQTQTNTSADSSQKSNVLNKAQTNTSAPSNSNQPSSSADEKTSNSDEKDTSISTKDMMDGMKIMSKIDMNKVSGLTSGNATAEEKKASVKYIKDTLTNEEIAKAIELMAKYKETLKEER